MMPKPKQKARLHGKHERVVVTNHDVIAEPRTIDTLNGKEQIEDVWDNKSLYGPDAYQGDQYPVSSSEVQNTDLCSEVPVMTELE